MKVSSFHLLIAMGLLSCATPKWKERYASKHMHHFQNKFGNQDIFGDNVFVLGDNIPTDKDYYIKKTNTRSEFKKRIYYLGRSLAMVPDSIRVRSDGIDSFYINKHKVNYINKNGLKSPNIIFME